jgi:hypothetical protein
MSGKNFATSRPPLANSFEEKILISDWNVVGKCDTTPPPFFILFATALDIVLFLDSVSSPVQYNDSLKCIPDHNWIFIRYKYICFEYKTLSHKVFKYWSFGQTAMRVEKREFAWEFSQLSCPGQTRTRVARELMRVDESWEVRVCMRVFSTLMRRSNENKSCMWVDESWEARVCMRVFSTLMRRSNENKRLHLSWWGITARVAKTLINSHQNLNYQFKVDESWSDRVHEYCLLAVKRDR